MSFNYQIEDRQIPLIIIVCYPYLLSVRLCAILLVCALHYLYCEYFSYTNKTDHNNMAEILLKVALKTITPIAKIERKEENDKYI